LISSVAAVSNLFLSRLGALDIPMTLARTPNLAEGPPRCRGGPPFP